MARLAGAADAALGDGAPFAARRFPFDRPADFGLRTAPGRSPTLHQEARCAGCRCGL